MFATMNRIAKPSDWGAYLLLAKHGLFPEGSRWGHFLSALPLELHALYLDRSRDARPLNTPPESRSQPTGHKVRVRFAPHPLRSILHRGLLGAALGKPGRSFTRVTALAHECPRRLVIGYVLRRGHARNSAAGKRASRFRSFPKPARRRGRGLHRIRCGQ